MITSSSLDSAALLLSVLGPLVTAAAALGYQTVLSRLPAAQRARVQQIVGEIVPAVEQANASLPGPAKKAIAQQLIAQAATAAHVSASPADIDRFIEASVFALNLAQAQKSAVPGPATPASAATAAAAAK